MRTPKCAPKSALLTTGSNNCADVEDIDLRLRRTISDHELQNTIFNVIHCILIFQCLSGHASVHIPVHVSHLLHAYIYIYIHACVHRCCGCVCVFVHHWIHYPRHTMSRIKSYKIHFPTSKRISLLNKPLVYHGRPPSTACSFHISSNASSAPVASRLRRTLVAQAGWIQAFCPAMACQGPCDRMKVGAAMCWCIYHVQILGKDGEGWGRMGKGRRMQEDGITIKK